MLTWHRTLCIVLTLCFLLSACASEKETAARTDTTPSKDGARTYVADFKSVAEAAAEAAFEIGLTVKEGRAFDKDTYLVECAKEIQLTGSSTLTEVAGVNIFVERLSDKETRVRVETSLEKSSGLAGSRSNLGLAEYDDRILGRLDKKFSARESANASRQE